MKSIFKTIFGGSTGNPPTKQQSTTGGIRPPLQYQINKPPITTSTGGHTHTARQGSYWSSPTDIFALTQNKKAGSIFYRGSNGLEEELVFSRQAVQQPIEWKITKFDALPEKFFIESAELPLIIVDKEDLPVSVMRAIAIRDIKGEGEGHSLVSKVIGATHNPGATQYTIASTQTIGHAMIMFYKDQFTKQGGTI